MLKKLLSLVLPTESYPEMETKEMSLKEKITIESLREVFDRKGYRFFANGKYNLNLLGVRKNTSASNKFDDYLVAVYKNESDEWQCLVWEATTDPGKHWLENPLSPKGTAILIPNNTGALGRLVFTEVSTKPCVSPRTSRSGEIMIRMTS